MLPKECSSKYYRTIKLVMNRDFERLFMMFVLKRRVHKKMRIDIFWEGRCTSQCCRRLLSAFVERVKITFILWQIYFADRKLHNSFAPSLANILQISCLYLSSKQKHALLSTPSIFALSKETQKSSSAIYREVRPKIGDFEMFVWGMLYFDCQCMLLITKLHQLALCHRLWSELWIENMIEQLIKIFKAR